MKLLIVDDEEKTTTYLSKGLSEEGFVVDQANNGEEGLYAAQFNQYDLIILDVMLPNLDGWEIIKQFRRKDKDTPVLFLTARDEVEDKVKGLSLGADDYLIKPFSFSELVARIKTLLRRSIKTQEANFLIVDDLKIDFDSLKVTRGRKYLNLTQQEFLLLSYLIRNKAHVLSRAMIAEAVWGMNFDSCTNIVDVAIRRLRAKVDDNFKTKLIHTVRGLGYVLEVR